MKLRLVIVLACTLLGVSACVVEPYPYGGGYYGSGGYYGGGGGGYYGGGGGGYYGGGQHEYGRRVWR